MNERFRKVISLYIFMDKNVIVGYLIVDFKEPMKDLYLWLGGILPEFQGQGYFGISDGCTDEK